MQMHPSLVHHFLVPHGNTVLNSQGHRTLKSSPYRTADWSWIYSCVMTQQWSLYSMWCEPPHSATETQPGHASGRNQYCGGDINNQKLQKIWLLREFLTFGTNIIRIWCQRSGRRNCCIISSWLIGRCTPPWGSYSSPPLHLSHGVGWLGGAKGGGDTPSYANHPTDTVRLYSSDVLKQCGVHLLSQHGAASLLVLSQQRDPGEGLEAARTLVLFDIRVGLQVSSQVGSVGKGSAAVEAGEWFLSCKGNTHSGQCRYGLLWDSDGMITLSKNITVVLWWQVWNVLRKK